jgi:NAD(P)-dependent dehydrogenase (short-subunit alcohol dehydrogenase family)
MPDLNFAGKVALVTGGTSGIGRAAALAFARHGAKVVFAARHVDRGAQVEREIRDAGGEAHFVRADMANAADVKSLVQKCVDLHGRLDCAFNNAVFVEGKLAPLADITEDEFDCTMNVNLKGIWLCMKYEIQAMLAQTDPGGAIVNTSSVNGLGGARLGSAYSASKAGILGLTKSAAQEYAKQNIRVNTLVAGAFETPLLGTAMDQIAAMQNVDRSAVAAQYRQWIPLGRIGSPEEAAEAVLWLCSSASSYVTGHSMIVDGGLSSSMR